jgi:hypothetical protein
MVHLRPFSRDQLNVFIEIEEPRDPLAELAQFSPGEIGECTIGEFYLSIEDAIDSLPDSAFVGDPSLQVGPELMWGSIAVTGKATADAAIDTIIEQGEGTKTSPEEIGATDDESGFAHYYRFMQVFEGRRLVKALDGDTEHFVFEGEEIDFDVAGVYPLPEDPVASNYAEGTPERMAIDECNLTYNRLLDCLHFLFNGGANSETFGVALGLMRTLEHQAKVLVTTETANGVALAPTFEYAAIE